MHWVLHASQAKAALATGVFAGSMATGRLLGDAVIRRTGPKLCVRLCGLLGTAGCLLVAASASTGAALAGFLLIGIGVSVVIPLVFAAAGNSGASPALGVAGVATISYGAGLAAPSAMGGIADVSSLRVAFAVAALLACAVVAGAGLLERPASAAARPEHGAGAGRSEEDQLDGGDDADQHDEYPQGNWRQAPPVPRADDAARGRADGDQQHEPARPRARR